MEQTEGLPVPFTVKSRLFQPAFVLMAFPFPRKRPFQ